MGRWTVHCSAPRSASCAHWSAARWRGGWAPDFARALALLSKYSAALTMAGGVLYLLTSREHRQLAGDAEALACALLVASLMFAPVLAWNAAHGWASFAFQAGRADGDAPPTVRPTGDACRRGAVRSAMDLAADDGRVRRGAASRSRRVAVLAAVLSGRPANRRIRRPSPPGRASACCSTGRRLAI